MKKLLSLTAAVIISATCLAGCGDSNTSEKGSTTIVTETTTENITTVLTTTQEQTKTTIKTTTTTTTTTQNNLGNAVSLKDAWEAFLDMPVSPSTYRTFRTVLPMTFESYSHSIRMGDKTINPEENESQYYITISGNYYYAPEVVDYTTPTYGTIKFVFSIELKKWILYEQSKVYGSIFAFAERG